MPVHKLPPPLKLLALLHLQKSTDLLDKASDKVPSSPPLETMSLSFPRGIFLFEEYFDRPSGRVEAALAAVFHLGTKTDAKASSTRAEARSKLIYP